MKLDQIPTGELKENRNDIKRLIEGEKKYLEDYKDFYFKDGEYYFFISFVGLNKSNVVTKLDDLWDIQSEKLLSEKRKAIIKGVCETIILLEKRLNEIREELYQRKFGNVFGNPKEEIDNSNKPYKRLAKQEILYNEYMLRLGENNLYNKLADEHGDNYYNVKQAIRNQREKLKRESKEK